MIDVKEATGIALGYFGDLYAEAAFSNVMLEEVEREEEGEASYWLITLGFTDEDTKRAPLAALTRPRRYKRFTINAETGEVEAMKIRSVENA